MFTWTSVSIGVYQYNSDMYMNSDIIASNWARGGSGNSGASSNTVIIHCDTGARVYIQCGTIYNCHPLDHYYDLQTFSGLLLEADEV